MEPRETLSEGLKSLALPADEGTLDLFDRYLSELKKWNKAYSITSIREDRQVVISHFLDSALYLQGLDDVQSLADIGSGGGFPGVVLKILRPELGMHLVEPNRKKATFLRMLVGRLSLKGVTVHECRMEDMDGVLVDAAVTRALFSVREFYEGTDALVREGGCLVLSKGPKYKEELEGVEFGYEVMDIELPFSDAVRHIIVIRK